jgi:tripeptidyl-peptidase-1
VAEAERLLSTKYHVYHHEPSGEKTMRTLSYSIPHILHQHIDMIAPTTYFGTFRTMRRTSFLQPEIVGPLDEADALADPVIDPILADIPPGCKLMITPACLRALYNSTNYVPKSSSRNQLGVAGYSGQYANDVDLQVRVCSLADVG